MHMNEDSGQYVVMQELSYADIEPTVYETPYTPPGKESVLCSVLRACTTQDTGCIVIPLILPQISRASPHCSSVILLSSASVTSSASPTRFLRPWTSSAPEM